MTMPRGGGRLAGRRECSKARSATVNATFQSISDGHSRSSGDPLRGWDGGVVVIGVWVAPVGKRRLLVLLVLLLLLTRVDDAILRMLALLPDDDDEDGDDGGGGGGGGVFFFSSPRRPSLPAGAAGSRRDALRTLMLCVLFSP
jgi:hypothetical protein